jgi:hypothetical protein
MLRLPVDGLISDFRRALLLPPPPLPRLRRLRQASPGKLTKLNYHQALM